MALQSALVDRARWLREDRTGVLVEGQPQVTYDLGPWFHCRIEPANTSRQADDGHWERVAKTWLICGKRDVNYNLLVIYATDYILVYSNDVDEGEDNLWQIEGDVTPMRRRQGLLGFEFSIVQVREKPTWFTSIPAGTP